jgi:hypothetical protein
MAWTMHDPGSHQEAIKSYPKAVEINPCNLNSLLDLGNMLLLHKKFAESEENNVKALIEGGSFIPLCGTRMQKNRGYLSLLAGREA